MNKMEETPVHLIAGHGFAINLTSEILWAFSLFTYIKRLIMKLSFY